MAEKAKKNNKNLIIGICAGVLVIAVVIVAVIFATKSSLNDAYFVSDDSKYVLTVDRDMLETEDKENSPIKTHIVYYYSGDTITGVTTYMEFDNDATAKVALDLYKNADQTGVKSLKTDGKYLVVEMTEDQYKDLTASDVKQQVEFMEMLKKSGTNNPDGANEETTETIETDSIINETK